MTILLPAQATDGGLTTLIPILNQAAEADAILLDFQHVRFYHPAPIVSLLARIRHWVQLGKRVSISNHRQCPAKRYLQRINFFDQLGLKFEENFTRHTAGGRFVAIERVTQGSEVDATTRAVAHCMTHHHGGDSELKECLRYAIGEILTNVAQHSRGEGFICAQRYKGSNMIHVAIADNGIGLQKSFEGTSLESELTSPLLALQKAMEPEVSSALLRPQTGPYQESINKGVGLSMVNELIRQTYGRMRVITENAVFTRTGDTEIQFTQNDTLRSPGVTVELQINADQIDNYLTLINSVRDQVTPNELDNYDEMFD